LYKDNDKEMSIEIEGIKKRGRKKQEICDEDIETTTTQEKTDETATEVDYIKFWKDPDNFKDIKEMCLACGYNWKLVYPDERCDVINKIIKGRNQNGNN
jgi:rubrerythrin